LRKGVKFGALGRSRGEKPLLRWGGVSCAGAGSPDPAPHRRPQVSFSCKRKPPVRGSGGVQRPAPSA